MVKLIIERVTKNDGRTFSEEAIVSFFLGLEDYLGKVLVAGVKQGFDENKPIDHVEIELNFKFNNIPLDDRKLLEQYPDVIGFDFKVLMNRIKEK